MDERNRDRDQDDEREEDSEEGLDQSRRCPACRGTGRTMLDTEDGRVAVKCPVCRGKGRVRLPDSEGKHSRRGPRPGRRRSRPGSGGRAGLAPLPLERWTTGHDTGPLIPMPGHHEARWEGPSTDAAGEAVANPNAALQKEIDDFYYQLLLARDDEDLRKRIGDFFEYGDLSSKGPDFLATMERALVDLGMEDLLKRLRRREEEKELQIGPADRGPAGQTGALPGPLGPVGESWSLAAFPEAEDIDYDITGGAGTPDGYWPDKPDDLDIVGR